MSLKDSNNQKSPKPYFQQLQEQFTAHIRNPDVEAYQPEGEKAIEPRRLKAYQELFFNNLHDFFGQLFPVCKKVLGKERWRQLIREYMIKHQAETPLFHQLGEEFLLFLQNEYEAKADDPAYLFELAHYEWVELALMISEEEGLITEQDDEVCLACKYQLSSLAWPLAYEWPVHQISAEFQPEVKPQDSTTLLVYRADSSDAQDSIEFMELTPMLYSWLVAISEHDTALKALESVTEGLQVDQQTLQRFAQQTLQELINRKVLQRLS